MKLREVISMKKAGIHVAIWLLLLLLNILFINNLRIKVHTMYHIYFWLIYAVLFYVNYFVLMPKLFFRKRFVLYILSSVLLLLITFYGKRNIEYARMQKFISEEIEMPGKFIPRHPEDGVFIGKFRLNELPENSTYRMSKPIPFGDRAPMGARLFFPLYGLILIYTASISVRLIQKWKEDEKRRSEIEKENISTELSFLKQQVNPHFLFNALNSVYSLSINSSKPASEAILKLSSILRYMLYETENKLVKLQNEMDIIKNYIALQQLRLTKNVSVNYKIEGYANGLRIAPLLLLPIIENAFKHGADNVNDSFVDIAILISENQIELRVKNWIANKNPDKKGNSGIGIKNIKRRLNLLYPDNHLLVIDQGENIFSVQLKLNLGT